MTIAPLLATILVSGVAQINRGTISDRRGTTTASSSLADLVQLEAPIGHRQPTLNDLPPWLREEEKPGTDANPTQDTQSGSADVEQWGRRIEPNDGVPRICDPC
jgi:hypothetical protein